MALTKFGRNYELIVQLPDKVTQITIEPPFSLEFDITRSILSSANVCQIKVCNLGQNVRNLIRYDYSNILQPAYIQLRAGYGSNLAVIFSGSISQAWSVREGSTFITTIEGYDGGYAFVNAKVVNGAGPFPPGTPMESVYRALMSDLPNVDFGGISENYLKDSAGNIYTVSSRHNSYDGNPAQILYELSGGGFFIDNGKAFIMGDNFALAGSFTEINASTGLLNTPTKENFLVSAEMIFEPRLQVCQQVSLVSTTADQIGYGSAAKSINGNYKVASVKHRGMISPVVAGDAITSVELFTGFGHLSLQAVTK